MNLLGIAFVHILKCGIYVTVIILKLSLSSTEIQSFGSAICVLLLSKYNVSSIYQLSRQRGEQFCGNKFHPNRHGIKFNKLLYC